jgi:hypothetical protein
MATSWMAKEDSAFAESHLVAPQATGRLVGMAK